MDNQQFFDWAQAQSERKPIKTHINAFYKERNLTPTRKELTNLKSAVYARLRRGDMHEVFVYSSRHTPTDRSEVAYSQSKEITPISDLVRRDGYALPMTQTALQKVEQSLKTISDRVVRDVANGFQTLHGELELERVKRQNAEGLGARDRELADERARDKQFYQKLLAAKFGNGNGNDII